MRPQEWSLKLLMLIIARTIVLEDPDLDVVGLLEDEWAQLPDVNQRDLESGFVARSSGNTYCTDELEMVTNKEQLWMN